MPAGLATSGSSTRKWPGPSRSGATIGATGIPSGSRSVLHANVTLYAGVRVGTDCTLHAGCVLREQTELGDRVVLQAGVVLGTDGFGLSDTRAALRRYFEVDAEHVVAATLASLAALGEVKADRVEEAYARSGIDREARDPRSV